MNLPPQFEFSQGSIQDFMECRRRFKLRYIDRFAWPAIQAEPARENELAIRRGERFHRIAQQYLLGVPEERIKRMAEADADDFILSWWNGFVMFANPLLQRPRFVEMMLSMPIVGQILVAKYDLVIITEDGKAVIFDWKTSFKHPKRDWLVKRAQTRIYPFVLVNAGAAFNNNQTITAEQVEMVYWFTNFPTLPERLSYQSKQLDEDGYFLKEHIESILTLPAEGFEMTADEKRCKYCVYRSLCNRGIKAGQLGDFENGDNKDEFEINIDFDQINEVAF